MSVELARRLERTEAAANAAFVDARAATTPGVGAAWRDVGGTWAMFDGVGSPLTQTFGLGLFTACDDAHLASVEAFFTAHGSETFHEVSPLAGPTTLAALTARRYTPIEQSTVLCLSLDADAATRAVPSLPVRAIGADEHTAWADLAAAGWGETAELAAFMREFGGITARSHGCTCFVAEVDGVPAATGAMTLHEGVALFAGASTVPALRRRGAQAALLAARLQFARANGCDLAMMVAAPGSTSQLNAERAGFRPCYTRTKWHRGADAAGHA